MPVLDPNPPTDRWKTRLAFWLQLASLVATGWLLWRPAALSRWPHYTATWVLLQAVLYAAGACAAAGLITFVLYLLLMQDQEDVVYATLRTSTVAVWFAPAVILIADLSPAALAAALVLVVYATRILYQQWRLNLPPLEPAAPGELFSAILAPSPSLWRCLAPSLAAAVSAQTGLVAILLKRPALAGLALAMSAATLTVFAHTSRAVEPRRPVSLPRSALGLLVTLVLAIGLTVGGMMPRFMHRRGGVGDGGTSSIPAPPMLSGAPAQPSVPATGTADDGFPGVILWPEIKPYATLIAPMPQTRGLGTAAPPRPMSIPFSGEYWMFRWPYAHPPRSSFFQRGSPATLSFSTTDHRPLQMEAYHKLEQSIALDCCSSIQMAVRNADRYPGTIALELLLIDGHGGREVSLSLGRAPVRSEPKVSGDDVTPVSETLDFAVPASAPIQSFDEFKILFLRDRRRMDKSAKLAIERFILVPKL